VPLNPLAANSAAAVAMILACRSRAEARLPFGFFVIGLTTVTLNDPSMSLRVVSQSNQVKGLDCLNLHDSSLR